MPSEGYEPGVFWVLSMESFAAHWAPLRGAQDFGRRLCSTESKVWHGNGKIGKLRKPPLGPSSHLRRGALRAPLRDVTWALGRELSY